MKKQMIKMGIDIVMLILLPVLMAEMILGQQFHEWVGTVMVIAFIAHHLLNLHWHKGIVKGKYTITRALGTFIDLMLFMNMIALAVSGVMMSGYVFNWLPISGGMFFARRLHLMASFWGLVIMSLHLGLHVNVIMGYFRKMFHRESSNRIVGLILKLVVAGIAVYGAVSFVGLKIFDYLFLRTSFMFYDSSKGAVIYFVQILGIVILFAAIAYYLNLLLLKVKSANTGLKIATMILSIIVCVMSVLLADGKIGGDGMSGTVDWSANTDVDSSWNVTDSSAGDGENSSNSLTPNSSETNTSGAIADGYVLINGGTYLMGSPDSEDWRSPDETQHSVTVSDFYASVYEVTQHEYFELMGENPSTFSGEELPVENVSWLDAVKYCNAKSAAAGLTQAYVIDGEHVSWNRSADGYRLPTEAEWEYACRAGTSTPFNTEDYISPEQCNYYGHYPYMIEGNYFNQSDLTTKPGIYRETTVEVGTFSANKWGLYDCHGNVGEWVWDYYGDYDLENTVNPTGPESGTMHISRGGGWNDFGKNLRSSYRATSQDGMAAYNVGMRLVRGAVADGGTVGTARGQANVNNEISNQGKMLIVFYSWGGNTRGVANEIASQTGADLFELQLATPYSTDYNTVLEQAQHDQNIQARPALANHVDDISQYDTIFIGYPNWWASIPMPIATFLDEYDLSGKTIMPFCSHGGGRFGQSLTAIAKAEPQAVMKSGLSVHYSGGSTLKSDVTQWLSDNGISQ